MSAAKGGAREGKHVAVVGAGGNIGSHLAPHLVRLPGVSRVTLIDRDRYERGNLLAQDFEMSDVGGSKAEVQAARLRRVRPGEVEVQALTAPVETLPWGLLRADLVLSGLDSRVARQHLNERIWRLGVPWIDAGVEGGGLLARVSVFLPGRKRACLECGWDERDYELLEQPYPCGEDRAVAAPSGSPSGLGALAAALQALEARKLLEGSLPASAYGREILLDASTHELLVTGLRRNRRCRLEGHEPWEIETLRQGPSALSLADLLGHRESWLEVAGGSFARRMVCGACGEERETLRLLGSLRPRDRRCPACRSAMEASAYHCDERLAAAGLPASWRRRSLASVGLRPGELFTVGAGERRRHFQLTGDRR
jgi:molybdopterin/thiamine biosynthesis adenylyltransferase